MLKEIINAFRGSDVVEDLEAKIGQMLDAGHWMFQQVSELLAQTIAPEDISDTLYDKDREINHLEQQIREKIVTHLSVGNPQDLGPCLVFMSIVKDAERIGDYCKNIYEVAKFYQGEFKHQEYHIALEEIRETIEGMFEPTKKAFMENERTMAKEVIQKKDGISKSCNMLVQQLLSVTGDLPANEAVAYVLLARYYKRVESHLSNVASSVVSPVPLLDFHGKLE